MNGYVINVARPTVETDKMFGYNGKYRYHFRAEVEYGNVKRVYDELCKAFPDCKIEVTKWENIGQSIDMSTFEH